MINMRKTVLSSYDCAARCNKEPACGLFTYNVKSKSDCSLYTQDSRLSSDCGIRSTKTFILFTRGQFTRPASGAEDVYLVDETNFKEFNLKSVVECAALCDEAFPCRSFRIDEATGNCKVFESEQYAVGNSNTSKPGDLYVYYSDFYFVQLPESFCVSSSTFISVVKNAPLEACKTMCDKLEACRSFEHDQDGNCQLYRSSDFSVQCSGKFQTKIATWMRVLF